MWHIYRNCEGCINLLGVIGMRKVALYIALGTSILLCGSIAIAKVNQSKRVKANVEAVSKTGKWVRDKMSTLQTKGLSIADANTCERFDVEVLNKNLIYKIRCGRHYSSGLIPLSDEKEYKVDKSGDQIIVTKISYYGQKIQTSQVGQSLVKMPYVEEVTFLKFLKDGSLTFYKENFFVDDFGRVVQKSFLQGHGLSNREIKLGRNYQGL